jgi:hypothetical protein
METDNNRISFTRSEFNRLRVESNKYQETSNKEKSKIKDKNSQSPSLRKRETGERRARRIFSNIIYEGGIQEGERGKRFLETFLADFSMKR